MKKILSKLTFSTTFGVVTAVLGLANMFGYNPFGQSVELTLQQHLIGGLISGILIYVDEKRIKAAFNRFFDVGVKRVDDELQGGKDTTE